MKTTTTITCLAAILLIAAFAGAADPTSAPVGRIWAESGDHVGLFNHWTLTAEYNDAYGAPDRSAEDWRRFEEKPFAGLFAWRSEGPTTMAVRGAADNRGDSGGAVGLFAGASAPGVWDADVFYKRVDRYYDGTSEMRYPMPTEPTALDTLPGLSWKRGNARLRYRAGDALTFRLVLDDLRREGTKSSLARGANGLTPAIREYETKQHAIDLGADWILGAVSGDLGLRIAKAEGTRSIGDGETVRHDVTDDREVVRFGGGAAWNATDAVRVLGRYGMSTVKSKPAETTGVERASDLQADANTGVVGVLWNPTRDLRGRFSARVHSMDVTGTTTVDDDEAAVDRQRTRRTLRGDVDWRGLARTRVRGWFRHDVRELCETLSGTDGFAGALDHVTAQKRTITGWGLRVRRVVADGVELRAGWRAASEDVIQSENSGLRYWQGDRTVDTWKAEACVRWRPERDVRIDLGGQKLARDFARKDLDGVTTEWSADRAFALASWLTGERLTLLCSASYGHEVYVLGDGTLEADEDWAAVDYDATTLRFAPGAVVDLGGGLTAEGHWEMVRNRDSVENDYDRLLVRAAYRLSERLTATALFRKTEFDENRWDDYILDLYAVSLSGRF